MKIGIFPGWLLAAAIARWIGGFPADLCIAGASIGIGLSLAAVARSSKALASALAGHHVRSMQFHRRFATRSPIARSVINGRVRRRQHSPLSLSIR